MWQQSSEETNVTPNLKNDGPLNGRYITIPRDSLKPGVPTPGTPTPGSQTPGIFADVRDQVFGYKLSVPNGAYSVTMEFCEPEVTEKENRVFDIWLQGKRVVEKLDIFARVGRFAPLVLSFDSVLVSDGKLLIDFGDRINYPAIAGLSVQGNGYSRYINCGGPASGAYEADWPATPRDLAVRDYYLDWAGNQFGAECASAAGAIFARLDENLPFAASWADGGPGGVLPDRRPWTLVEKSFAFVDDLAALEPQVRGNGNRDRFAYWLNSFKYLREMARINCLSGDLITHRDSIRAHAGSDSSAAALKILLPKYFTLVGAVDRMLNLLLSTVSTSGEMGTVMNWEEHNLPVVLEKPGKVLSRMMRRSLPAGAHPSMSYAGTPRVIVPCVRTSLSPKEKFTLKVLLLSKQAPGRAHLRWRPLGKGDFRNIPLVHVARGVYKVEMKNPGEDFEYYVEAQIDKGEYRFPATAPKYGSSVIIE
jgi:hypothetical protein